MQYGYLGKYLFETKPNLRIAKHNLLIKSRST